MPKKSCSYSVLAPKGNRKSSRRSCKKTKDASKNSANCEVLYKRCGLKENHIQRVHRHTFLSKKSKSTSQKKNKPVSRKRSVVAAPKPKALVVPKPKPIAAAAPRLTQSAPVVVAPVLRQSAPAPTKPKAVAAPASKLSQSAPALKPEPKVVVPVKAQSAPVVSNQSKELDQLVNELRANGNSRAYYSNAAFVNSGSMWEVEEDKKIYDAKVKLFKEIQQKYSPDIINITTTSAPENSSLDWYNTEISVKPNMQDKFKSMN